MRSLSLFLDLVSQVQQVQTIPMEEVIDNSKVSSGGMAIPVEMEIGRERAIDKAIRLKLRLRR